MPRFTTILSHSTHFKTFPTLSDFNKKQAPPRTAAPAEYTFFNSPKQDDKLLFPTNFHTFPYFDRRWWRQRCALNSAPLHKAKLLTQWKLLAATDRLLAACTMTVHKYNHHKRILLLTGRKRKPAIKIQSTEEREIPSPWKHDPLDGSKTAHKNMEHFCEPTTCFFFRFLDFPHQKPKFPAKPNGESRDVES